jgi:hypothetical protein
MCKSPKYDTNMSKETNSFNILEITKEAKYNPENKTFDIN